VVPLRLGRVQGRQHLQLLPRHGCRRPGVVPEIGRELLLVVSAERRRVKDEILFGVARWIEP
jgi:hypothetical protein